MSNQGHRTNQAKQAMQLSQGGSTNDLQPINMLFVYGSLMSGQTACSRLLLDSGCRLIGRAFLSGYHLYDLGAYPAILPAQNQAKAGNTSAADSSAEPVALVCGEVYIVDAATLQQIDAYECEGSLYRRQPVVVHINGQPKVAWTYVYLNDIEPGRLVPLGRQPWQRGCLEQGTGGVDGLGATYVWYAAYGSNCLFERFRCYIEGGCFRGLPKVYAGCSDKTLPLADRPYELPYDMYFAKYSGKNWKSSVCFLDPMQRGHAYGRIFLVTVDQFHQIHEQEGISDDWYGKTLTLGELDGIPVKTFTNRNRLPGEVPSSERLPLADPYRNYFDVVRKGLLETWGDRLDEATVERYLEECAIPKT